MKFDREGVESLGAAFDGRRCRPRQQHEDRIRREAADTGSRLGEIAIKTLSTWGHSPGQTTFYVTGLSYPLAVVGDSLFACSMGGSQAHYADQYKNDVEKILRLPKNTVLACGHGPLTTVAQEKRHNPFFAS